MHVKEDMAAPHGLVGCVVIHIVCEHELCYWKKSRTRESRVCNGEMWYCEADLSPSSYGASNAISQCLTSMSMFFPGGDVRHSCSEAAAS